MSDAPKPEQEIFKQVPAGYRAATAEERCDLLELMSVLAILKNESVILEKDKALTESSMETLKANVTIYNAKLEDKRIHIARAKADLLKARRALGIADEDVEGVLKPSGGVMYLRLPKEEAPKPPANGHGT